MTKEHKILILAFFALNLVAYLAMVIYNTSFALSDWNDATRAILSGCILLSFAFVAWWILFKE